MSRQPDRSPRRAPRRSTGRAGRSPRADHYEIRETFRVPIDFAFRWCTDYTPEDGQLAGDGHARRILSRSGRRVVYETLYDYPEGWAWSRQTVTLHPPNRWTATAVGNYRNWDLVYTLRPRGREITEFTFHGVRTPVGLARKNPSQRALNAELHEMWQHFGRAMRTDYLREIRRSRTGRPRSPRRGAGPYAAKRPAARSA